MKILVTGANGYIGAHVVRWIVKNTQHQVVAVDVTSGWNLDRVDYREIDLLARANEEDLFQKLGCPEVVIHLAWKDGFKHNSDAHLANLKAHYDFLRNMIDSGCRNVSVMGTMHEVGYYEGMIDDVNPPPCNPMSMYAIAKNALRQAMFTFVKDKDVSFKWLRGFYITGDEARASSIFAKIAQMEAAGQKTFPFTDGKTQYDFVDVDELAKMIALSALRGNGQQIINVCSGQPVSLRDKVEIFLKEKKFTIRPEYGKFPSRPYDSPIIYGANGKILQILGE